MRVKLKRKKGEDCQDWKKKEERKKKVSKELINDLETRIVIVFR